jgi:outer membrane usher protein FimD/PapC
MSGYYSHLGSMADVTTNFNWAQSQYTSFGISASGGMTATAEGVALHSGGVQGGTRLMVSTDGVSGVPVGFQGYTNAFGIAVIPGCQITIAPALRLTLTVCQTTSSLAERRLLNSP